MAKNIVLLSLDAVSQTHFWQYREVMPMLWKLSNESAMFRRFYTSSISAFQSFCDLAHGNASELDHNSNFPNQAGCLAGKTSNLFSLLRRRGYDTLGIQHADPVPEYVQANFYGAWPDECGPFRSYRDYASFHTAINGFIDEANGMGRPFVLYCSDRVTRPDDASVEKAETPLYHERFERSFALLDRTATKIVKTLASRRLLTKTIIVVFGPYGMDPWKHGVFRGRTVGTIPYADNCWTPLFIWNNNNDVGIPDQLMSIIDMKPTLLHMLFPHEQQPEMKDPLSGFDILRYQRQVVFTQNLFTLERENQGPALGLTKSYAATDGEQRLIVTSNGGIPGEGGMELYFDPRDPGNTRNFLDFFNIDAKGNMIAFGRSDIIHVHFTQSFKPNLVMSIVHSYNRMKDQLYEFIRMKERTAARLPNADPMAAFPEESFNKKQGRR